jgi:hypothetical protein
MYFILMDFVTYVEELSLNPICETGFAGWTCIAKGLSMACNKPESSYLENLYEYEKL